ncbi:MAG: alpha-galactosidase [Armatimonadota bacterium]|nr:alpha-galactosidase [bacterium]
MAIAPTKEEFSRVQTWFESTFKPVEGQQSRFPVSFSLGGDDSKSLLSKWKSEWQSTGSDDTSTRYTVTFTDPDSGLECRCEIKLYKDFPAVEWVGHFKNNAEKDSSIISDIQALDTVLPNDSTDDWVVHYARGSEYSNIDFEPQEYRFRSPVNKIIHSADGRSSDGINGGSLPFFNLQLSKSGVIGAIGWTGDWALSLIREGYTNGEMQVRAGMKKTHLKLHPGEEIRAPRMLLLFWEGDRTRAHNMWRQLIMAHYRPTVNGAPAMAPVCEAVWGEVRDSKQIEVARWWHENDIPIDAFWIDAGWHGDAEFNEDASVFNSNWGGQVGNWWPNKTTYPNGLKPVGDTLKKLGLGFVLWLEPERVCLGTGFTREHPEWLQGPICGNYLFNLGIPEAREYLIDLISSLISEGGITVYRQDFNMGIAPFWAAADASDRVGISEIRHIEGLYAFWDGLRSRNPGLLIDNCSSGGRRIDLETNSRSIPLWRSDYQCFPGFNPTGMQNQTEGLAPWVPLSTGSCDRVDTYTFRSAFGPGIVLNDTTKGYGPSIGQPAEWLRKMVREQKEISKYFYGDFYPLLSYSQNDDVWALWQFDRPDLNEGLILAFRRQQSPFSKLDAAKLQALEPDGIYEIRSFDSDQVKQYSGTDLMEKGFPIVINEKPGSAVFVYKKV